MMVSDGGQVIRCPIDQISLVGRSARGVTVFKLAEAESLVSVSRLRDENGEEEGPDVDEGVTDDAGASSRVVDDAGTKNQAN